MKRVLAKMDKLQTGSSSNLLLDPKWLSLGCFILQNTLLIIGLKACVINSSHSMSSYITSTAVILAEILKFILSTLACFFIDCKGNYSLFKEVIYTVLMEEGADVLKLCVPAILYTIQNNLQYVIEEAPLFLVLYQAKIITTALFYSTMLNRRMNSKEWMCIVALTLGVGMVESSQMEIVPNHVGKIAGVVAVIFACLTSGKFHYRVFMYAVKSFLGFEIALTTLHYHLSSECYIFLVSKYLYHLYYLFCLHNPTIVLI